MKNKFFKKVFLGLVLITVLGILSAGCGGGGTPIPIIPVVPTTYTVTVMSQHPWCFGTVYVNGLPTGTVIIPWGAGTVSNVASGAAIYLVDAGGFQSHTEIFNPLMGTTVVFDYWW